MKRLIATVVCLSTIQSSAFADDLFIPISVDEQQELADTNFEFYHHVAFTSVPDSIKIVRLNDTAFDKDNDLLTLNFIEGGPSLSLKNNGIKPLNNRSALGLWSGKLDSKSDVSIFDLSDGKLDKKVTIYVKLHSRNSDQENYHPAPGLFSIRDQTKSLQKSNKLKDDYVGPVPPTAQFLFAIHQTDLLMRMSNNSWITFRLESLPNNPDYVVISEPDAAKQFDHADGYVSDSEVTRKEKFVEQHDEYVKKAKKDKERRDAEKAESE